MTHDPNRHTTTVGCLVMLGLIVIVMGVVGWLTTAGVL